MRGLIKSFGYAEKNGSQKRHQRIGGADAVTRTENDDIKHAKDIAAAGVTVSAMISITVGFALFADIERIAGTLKYILGNISAIIVFAVIILADILLLTLVKETKQDRNLKGTK